MPEISQEVEVTVSFEVYCNECSAGLCPETTVKKGNWRGGHNTIYVNPCPRCLADKDSIIEALKSQINELEKTIRKANQ